MGAVRARVPLGWSWTIALTITYLLVWSAEFFRTCDITRPSLWVRAADVMYHLALTGELKNHMPPTVPMVQGEPLLYHWFTYAHLASASWVTGIEPMVLQLRLAMVPMIAGIVVLVGVTGWRITGRWAGGALAVVGTALLQSLSLFRGSNLAYMELNYGGFDTLWISPTQTFGALLFAPVVIVLLDLLRRRSGGAGRWVLLGVLLVAVMGAKATYLPLLGAGLGLVVVVEAVVRRRIHRPALGALGMTTGCFAFSQFILYGGTSHAMVFEPLYLTYRTWDYLAHRSGERLIAYGAAPAPPLSSMLGVALVYLVAWAVALCGIVALLSRARLPLRPGVALLLGIGAAGFAGMLAFAHPGASYVFFLIGAHPYLAVLAAYGILVVVGRARLSRAALAAAAGAGVAAAYLLPWLLGVEVPLRPDQPESVLYWPYAVLVAGIAVVAVVLGRAAGARRAWAVMTVALSALCLPATFHERVDAVAQYAVQGELHREGLSPRARIVSRGALRTLRWLRSHSEPDELVATNANCRWEQPVPCESHRFWVAAFSERRVLLEGWAYTATNLGRWRPGKTHLGGFWDRERFLDNRRAFEDPSPSTVGRLHERYGVRWLFVDESRMEPGDDMGDVAELRFRSGRYAVYRVPDLGSEHRLGAGGPGSGISVDARLAGDVHGG